MRVKYPRTLHLPWSLGVSSDDKVLKSTEHFAGKVVVVTEKMDGENTTAYRDYYHARSIDSRFHPSRAWFAKFHSSFCYSIPEGWRVCGENLYALHSVEYTNLPSYFMAFSVWDQNNVCLSWDDTTEWLSLLDITPVNVLYYGLYDENVISELHEEMDLTRSEGYVVRSADAFHYDDFQNNVAKFVRPNHVQTDKHWMHSVIITNQLKGN